MKKRTILTLIGAIIFIISLPTATKMIAELIHNQKMEQRYTITNVSAGYPPTEASYQFQNHLIEIDETIINEDSYIDPWSNKVKQADLSIKLDGKQLDSLKGYPVRVEEIGLNRYYGELAYLLLEDKKADSTQFIILLKKTRELPKELPNGDIVDFVPKEKLKYAYYAIDEEGQLQSETFRLTERDALQTELLNSGFVAPHSLGYYTNAWEGYPSLFFPLLYPFVTLLLGLILMIIYFPIRKARKTRSSL